MVRFYTRFSGHNAPKNKLQKTIVEYFKSLNGYIVDGEEFIKELKRKVEILSLGHSKCKKIELSSFDNDNGITISCGDEWTCHLYLYIIKENH